MDLPSFPAHHPEEVLRVAEISEAAPPEACRPEHGFSEGEAHRTRSALRNLGDSFRYEYEIWWPDAALHHSTQACLLASDHHQ